MKSHESRLNNGRNKDPGSREFWDATRSVRILCRCSICMAKNLPSNIFLVTFFIWYGLHSTSLEFLSSISFLHRYIGFVGRSTYYEFRIYAVVVYGLMIDASNFGHDEMRVTDGLTFFALLKFYFPDLFVNFTAFHSVEFLLVSRACLILSLLFSSYAVNFYKTLICSAWALILRIFIHPSTRARAFA